MTAKTRYFLVGSVLVLVVGLSIGLVAYYGGMPQGLFSGQQGPEELKYIPGDAAVVAYANVQQVMGSQLRQHLRAFEGSTDEGRNEFREKTGIDIENDIDHVVACMNKKDASGQAGGMVIAKGRFGQAQSRLEALATEQGGTVEDYKGKRILLAPTKHPHEGDTHAEMAMAFLGPNLVALGGVAAVKRAIDGSSESTSVLGNAGMMKLVSGVDNASMWAVGRFDAISAGVKLPDEVAGQIPALTWFSASGHVNGGIQATVKAEAKNEESAKNLRDIIRGFTALAKMQAGSRPEMQKLMPDIQLTDDGSKVVEVSFAVTSDMLDALTAARHAAGALKKPEPKVEPKAEQK
ncbi:MAG: DUF3352 domain-containing protein [Acidobacteria bacterium]|nr:DUF3352 domain-containing protein [Acidobacteriota bacterium]